MKKAILIGIGLLILFFTWHTLLELLLHAIEIVLEVLELLVDTFMEQVMGLDLYESQKATAWLGFGVFLLLLVLGLKKLILWCQETQERVGEWWGEEKIRLHALRWRFAAVGVAALLVLMLFI